MGNPAGTCLDVDAYPFRLTRFLGLLPDLLLPYWV